ncbi:MAG: hypothetical protein U0531_01010 [Dehalococcoidia bacterium]
MDRLRISTIPRRRRPRRPMWTGAVGERAAVYVLAAAFGVTLFFFFSGNALALALLTVLAGAGTDQILRAHPRVDFQRVAATAIYLFVPVFAVAAALFLRDVAGGFWTVPAALFAAVVFAFAVQSEYQTVEATPETYGIARFTLSLVSYLTAFALFTVVFTSGLLPPAATLMVAGAALLLTVDILRELDVPTTALFAYAGAVAVVVAQVRWAMYYLALGDLLSGRPDADLLLCPDGPAAELPLRSLRPADAGRVRRRGPRRARLRRGRERAHPPRLTARPAAPVPPLQRRPWGRSHYRQAFASSGARLTGFLDSPTMPA